MFKSLKNKLKSWIKKEEEEIEETLDRKKELGEKPKEKKKKEKNVEKKGIFERISSKIKTTTLTQEKFDEIFDNLELILLENNVALSVVDKIKENLIEDLVGIPVKKGEIEKILNESLKDSISGVLKEPPNLIEEIKKKEGTYVIIIFGINGAGKTTSIAKLAHKLKKEKISCVLGAGDTFRAASIEQLEIHGEKLKIPVIKQDYNSDPAAVAFDTRKFAEKNKIKCAIIDTAGRMYTKENLIKQMAKIIRISQPDLKIFVGESITGNDATEQAKTFDESIGIDGIILTKADVDEKAGTILSVSHVTGKPIYFLGTGQNYQDLEDFKKEDILKKLDLDSEN
ncbi:signal recognition particle-docking protein FtsY [Candidatus Parvarchaeota archaeon]|nr:MAG: signal recognition particle-docking protein FtsY [Candidatus Parvarchaeota archaeon]